MSAVVVSGDTSGQISVAAPAVAGSNTLTLPAVTGTLAVFEASVYNVEDLAAFKALTSRPESVLVKTGQAAGLWQWVLGSATTANDGTVVSPTTGTAGRYKRVYDGPIRTSWFGTGIASLVAAWAVSKDLVCTPGEIYEFTNTTTHPLIATDETINIEAGLSTFKVGVNSLVAFAPVGSWSNVQGVSLISGANLTVSDGTVFTKGDVVKVVDETPLWHYRLGAKNGEFANVLSVAGNIVTLSRPLEYSSVTLPPAFIAANDLVITGAADNGAGLVRITATTNSATITGAANSGAGLVRITAAAHGFTDGARVIVQSVAGTTEANGTWLVTGSTANTFDLEGSTFANAYVSGGTAATHGYANGMQVKVQDVVGTTEANGTYIISGVTATTFDLVGTTYANAYVSGGTIYPTFQYSTTTFTLAATGMANNGAGLIRVTTAASFDLATGMTVAITGTVGTTEANSTWVVTKISRTTFDLVGSTFTNAWVSGGSCVVSPCRIGKIGTAPCRVNIGTVDFPTSITSTKGMLRPEARANIDIRIGYQNYVDGIAIQPVACYGGRCEIDMLVSGETNSSYGINLSNSENITAIVGTSGTVRHAVDGGGGGGAGAGVVLSPYGHSAYNRVAGFNRGSPDGAFVTHHGTYRWRFENCRSVGAASCVSVRGVGHTASNPESFYDDGALGMFNQYASTESWSDDFTIIDPMVRDAKGSAIGLNTGCRGRIQGGVVEYTGTTGTRLFEIGGEMTMTGTQINVFGVLSNRVFLAMDAGAAKLELNNVSLDFASNVLPSRLIDDLVGSGMVVRAKDVFIRNSSAATYFFRGLANLPAGSEIRNVEFTGDLTTLIYGETWSTIQPYIYGPVIVAGIEQMSPGFLQFGQPLTYTIATGAISVLGTNCVIDTEGGAGTDDLDTITVPTGTPDGTIVSIRSASPSRDPTVKNGTGNITLGADRTLTSPTDSVLLCYRLATNDFVGVAFSDNA